MNSRLRWFLPVLLLCLLLNSARAELEIKLARYGIETDYRDVRDIVQAYLRTNTLSFPVNRRSMGGATRGRDDYFYIQYIANGKFYKGSVAEGGVFTFQGVGNVPVARGPLPFVRPPAPTAAILRVANRSGAPARIYAIDRFGRWTWAENVESGGGFTAQAQVGQDWVITDSRNQVLQQFRVRAGENSIVLNRIGGPLEEPVAASRMRFENIGRRPLNIYSVDRFGSWNWVASLNADAVYSATTRPGVQWIATDRGNRVVQQVRANAGTTRVTLQ